MLLNFDNYIENNQVNSNLRISPAKITLDNICEFYCSAVEENKINKVNVNGVELLMNKFNKFIDECSMLDLIKIYVCGSRNESLNRLIIDKISENIEYINDNEENIKTVPLDLVIKLISHNNYHKCSQNLENILGYLVLNWFDINKIEHFDDQFMFCWNKLNTELFDLAMIIFIVKNKFYPRIEHLISKDIVRLYTRIARKEATSQKQRYMIGIEAKEAHYILSIDQVKSLKIYDRVDVQDSCDVWYVGTVRDINSRAIYISFAGWSDDYNEWINFDSRKIAKLGTMSKQELKRETRIGSRIVSLTNF